MCNVRMKIYDAIKPHIRKHFIRLADANENMYNTVFLSVQNPIHRKLGMGVKFKIEMLLKYRVFRGPYLPQLDI